MNILGISHPISMNVAACLIKDGQIVSINEEERFNRLKHSSQGQLLDQDYCKARFAGNAINECLKVGEITPQDIDIVAVGWNPTTELQLRGDRSSLLKPHTEIIFKGLYELGISKDKVHFYNHHVSHLASSFFCSGFSFSNLICCIGPISPGTSVSGGTAVSTMGNNGCPLSRCHI